VVVQFVEEIQYPVIVSVLHLGGNSLRDAYGLFVTSVVGYLQYDLEFLTQVGTSLRLV
jgi:hypothetical protein